MARSSIRVSEKRESEIIDYADAVTEEYPSEDKIDLVSVIENREITLSFNNYRNAFDGMLEHRQGRFHIYCNLDRVEHQDSPRARFTLAHELGHYFIDEHRRALASGRAPAHQSKCEYESFVLTEQEADIFASNLLMPKDDLLKRCKKNNTGIEGIRKLANFFGTSITSTAIRYAKLDAVPCAVIKWSADGFAWKWLSTETFKNRFYKTIESASELPLDSPTAKALKGIEPPGTGFFKGGSVAASWFKNVQRSSDRNVIFIEEAMPLGKYGVLTFLYPDKETYNFYSQV